MKGIILFTLITLTFAANVAAGTPKQAHMLAEKQWSLVEMNGRGITSSSAFLEIDVSAKRFSGNAGCNQIFGGVKLGGSSMRFGQAGMTRMACPDKMNAEAEFIRAMKQVTRYRLYANSLTMFAGSRIVLRFRATKKPVETPEPQKFRLEDRRWVLQSIGSSAVSLKEPAFLTFDRNRGSAGGNTGCNAFGGNYETSSGNRIRIFDTFSTMRACIEDNRMEVERDFLEGLRSADRYRISGNMLELLNGPNVLLTFRGAAK